jgi:hypothetical protein
MEVSHLTSTSASILNIGGVPWTNTGDLTVTTTSLSGKVTNVPSINNAFEPTTAGNGDGIDLLANFEYFSNLNWLFHERGSEVNLLWNVTAINLDFYNLSLLGI